MSAPAEVAARLGPLSDEQAARVAALLREVPVSRPEPVQDSVCVECGKVYAPDGSKGRGKSFCSRECYIAHPRQRREVVPPSPAEIVAEMKRALAELEAGVA